MKFSNRRHNEIENINYMPLGLVAQLCTAARLNHSHFFFSKIMHLIVNVSNRDLRQSAKYTRVLFRNRIAHFNLPHFFVLCLPAPIPLANLLKFPNELRLLWPAWVATADPTVPDAPPAAVAP